MTSRILALGCLFALAGAAQAQAAFPTTPPAPGPAPTLTMPVIEQQALANGLQVISVRRAGVPLVTARLLLKSGSERDPATKAGLAGLTADLLDKGAAGRSASEIAAAADALGGSLSADAGNDATSVGITVTTPKLPQALALLSDVAQRPDFADAELQRARKQTLDDLKLALSQPMTVARRVAAHTVFGDGGYGALATPGTLGAITRADVVALHAAQYRPDNAVLVLAGDITAPRARELAQAAFGAWARPAAPLPLAPAATTAARAAALQWVDLTGAGQAGVVIAHAAPRRGDAGYYVGQVANAILGGSYSARLNQEIRIKRGLSYGASSSFDPRRDGGWWMAGAQTKNPSAPQVVELMRAEAARLGSTPVPQAEFDARKATLIGGYGRGLQTTAGLAAVVGDLAVQGRDLAEAGRYIAQVQAVTPQQVQAYARAHLGADALRTIVVGDAAQFGAALRKAYPDARAIPAP